jgi:translation initiation factor 2B subunit (eIF-2B alpha/beta/delta family)
MSTAHTMKNVGFTVPPAMADEIERMAKKEHRTKSEFFRRMFTLYRTYREQLEQAEEEQFERMIDEVIDEAVKAQKEGRSLMTDEEFIAESKRLMEYGAEQAKKLGIDVEDDEVVNRMVHNVRARRREKNRA